MSAAGLRVSAASLPSWSRSSKPAGSITSASVRPAGGVGGGDPAESADMTLSHGHSGSWSVNRGVGISRSINCGIY
jgi:hypothetical protein